MFVFLWLPAGAAPWPQTCLDVSRLVSNCQLASFQQQPSQASTFSIVFRFFLSFPLPILVLFFDVGAGTAASRFA